MAELVLLAGLWQALLYGVSAVFFLPWGGGIHARTPTPDDWQEAHVHHELFVLAVGSLGGALVLLVCWRWRAALSWLVGGVVLVVGVHGQHAYATRVEVLEAQRQHQARIDARGYSTWQPFYDAQGKAVEPSTLPLRQAIPYENIAQKPAYPGGEMALRAAIQHRVRYPRAAQEQEVPVDVAVQCIVEPDGQLTVLHTSDVPGGCEGLGYEQEAVRVVQRLPHFVPGRRCGRAVAATYTVPVAFRPGTTGKVYPR